MTETPVKQRGLGRGLTALFGDNNNATEVNVPRGTLLETRIIPISFLEPGKFQPRRVFDDGAMDQLAASIKERGVLQPILVRRLKGALERYEIVAGERRWRAAQRAGLHEIPAVVREISDVSALEIALVENLQRQDLSPVEEAEGYSRLIKEFGHTQEELAKVLGKSRSHVTNMIRLLTLPQSVQEMVKDGRISFGHAKLLIPYKRAEEMAAMILKYNLSVRQVEEMIASKSSLPASGKGAKKRASKSADIRALELELTEALGLRVSIAVGRNNTGSVTVHYRNLNDFDAVAKRLMKK